MAGAARGATPDGVDLITGLGRAFAGALLFALPMLMTMELWDLGHVMPPLRLALLCALTLPLLVRLSRLGGLRRTASLRDDIADALVAVAVAALAAGVLLFVFGVLDAEASPREIVGKVAIQTVPGGIGAMLARNQLGEAQDQVEAEEGSYSGELFLMVVGALFLSLNIAPTDEVFLIAYAMDPWRQLALLGLGVALLHGFVFSFGFRGAEGGRPHEGFWSLLVRFTFPGYALAVAVSLYVLWSFGRLEGHAMEEALGAVIVLSFPGALGAAAARVVL